MVNFRDPSLIEKDAWAASKFWHAMAGLYLWEYVTTLDYEWGIIQGRRSSGWTIWIYSITRISTLMAVVLTLVSTNTTTEYNCQVETVFQLIFGYLSFAGASLLIVLRILAIWDMNKIVIGIATSVWAANVSFLIQGVVRIRAVWVPIETTCRITNTQSTKLNILITLATDIVLLVIMLVGLLRLGFHERTAFGVGSYMWKQGLIWLFIATIAEVPPAVFICLNLNDPFNYMFQIPSIIAMSIAATRIHRNLVNYASGSSDVPTGPDSAQTSGRTGSKSNRGVEVAIHPTFEQYHQTPHTSQNDSFSGVEGQLREKPTGLVFDDDVENGAAETPT